MYVSYTIHMILRCFHPYFLGQIWILPGTWPSQWIVWRFCSSNWLQPLGTAGYRWMPVSRCLDNAYNSSIFFGKYGEMMKHSRFRAHGYTMFIDFQQCFRDVRRCRTDGSCARPRPGTREVNRSAGRLRGDDIGVSVFLRGLSCNYYL